ncbi:MAG: hypothetical protein OHK0019_07380 [Saprospiraceae bacterium]
MKHLLLLFALLNWANLVISQDTFSIVAVDTLTGEVGSAGASCLDNISFPGSGGAIIISDLLPGRGAIHTQSFWNATNQANARLKMEEGLSPEQIINWLKTNDVGGILNAQQRQYGIVDFNPADGQPRSAAFTGTQCLDWKGHKTGTTYAIQGNILLGPEILDSMETRFLNTSGTLADRLMAALQGANVVGADTRCTNNGTSSLSAFLRVAKPENDDDNLYLDLNVPSLPAGQEPIDSLQTLYNQWKLTSAKEPLAVSVKIFPNPARGQVTVILEKEGLFELFNAASQKVFEKNLVAGENTCSPALPTGIYFAKITVNPQIVLYRKIYWQRL